MEIINQLEEEISLAMMQCNQNEQDYEEEIRIYKIKKNKIESKIKKLEKMKEYFKFANIPSDSYMLSIIENAINKAKIKKTELKKNKESLNFIKHRCSQSICNYIDDLEEQIGRKLDEINNNIFF